MSDKSLGKAVCGFLRREFRNAFLRAVPGYDITHYWPARDSLRVQSPLRDYLARVVSDLVPSRSNQITVALLPDWVDAALTTHYRNFQRAWTTYPYDYTPSFTRAAIGLLTRGPDESTLLQIDRCIAVDILQRVKDRRDLISVAADWMDSRAGKAVLGGYQQLREFFEEAKVEDRKRLAEEISGILANPLSAPTQGAVEVLALLQDIPRGKTSKEATLLPGDQHFRWLWRIRNPHALTQFSDSMKRLINQV